MILNKTQLNRLLEEGNYSAEKEIERHFGFFRQFDKNIDSGLKEMYHFGGYGQYFEMVGNLNKILFN